MLLLAVLWANRFVVERDDEDKWPEWSKITKALVTTFYTLVDS